MNEGEINTIKLTSGEEVVAKIMNIEDGMMVIKQPVSIGPNPQGGPPMLMPSMFTAEMNKDVILYASAISMVAPTREDVKVAYIKATTGIDVPAKKSIITG
jgi:hypothetical protein